jgi:hypothetical protein
LFAADVGRYTNYNLGEFMKLSLAFLLCFLSVVIQASQRAVTDEGNIVILNDNGTWLFENPESIEKKEIPLNQNKFNKSSSSIFKLKSTKNNTQVWLDAKKWSFKKANSQAEAEYSFTLKGQDLYGMLITERVQLGLETLTDVALENAKAAAPDAKITKKEYRIVNGNKVIYMEMQGTIQGANFTYFGHYFSNSSGTTQLLVFTGTSLTETYKGDIQNILNGFSVQK